MLKLNYQIHLLLNSKYRLFVNFFIYIIILFIYSILITDITIIECMKKAEPKVILSNETDRDDYVRYLEEEAWQMDKRIAELEQLTRRLTEEVSRLTAENRRLSDRITLVEYKDTSPKSDKID